MVKNCLKINKQNTKKKESKQSINPHHHEKDDGARDNPGYQAGTAQL